MNNKLMVNGAEISVTTIEDKDYISLTDMLKAKGWRLFHFRLAAQSEHGRVPWHLGADPQSEF